MTSFVAIFDIGTTAVKGMLLNEKAEMFETHTERLTVITPKEGIVEQQPEDWWKAIKSISAKWWLSGIKPESIKAITFSGQMEDTISLSKTERIYNAILYSDTRANKEAKWIKEQYPSLSTITGNSMSPTTPLAKMKWIQNNQHTQYEDTKYFVFSSKDFIIYKLTQKAVTDPVTAATTGMMDLNHTSWYTPIVQASHLNSEKLPQLLPVHATVGKITEKVSKESGFSPSTVVVNGSGDAGASTLGAGAVEEDEGYFYMGTTGWLAMIKRNEHNEQLSEGHFNLAFIDSKRISVAPLLNVGNVHNWAVESFVGEKADNKYEDFEMLINEVEPGSNGVVFLPYLNGERNPIMDVDAKGAYVGIHANTKRKHLARAALEGVTFSLKQTLEMFDLQDKRTLTLIGGGAKSKIWCQMMADIMNHPIRVPLNNEFLPSIGVAASAFSALGWSKSYTDFIEKHVKTLPAKQYEPIEANVEQYNEHYKTFVHVYPALKPLY